jgi:predicted nucleic acid-binding protein
MVDNSLVEAKAQSEAVGFPIFSLSIREISEVRLLDEALTFQALDLLKSYKFSFYDSLIVASALDAGCGIFFSEDMQDEQWIQGRVQICNPF